MTRAFVTALVALGAIAPGAAAAGRANQMVVFKSGRAELAHPRMAQTSVRLHGRRCVVASNTPLAALVSSRVAKLSLRDYGSCSSRPSDGGGLFVSAIGADRNRGSDGWVYKAGNVLGTAGAADPSGPVGRGRLRNGAHVVWFWCHVTKRDGGCPHTLMVSRLASDPGQLAVRVRRYDDFGKARAAGQAVLRIGGRREVADANGVVRVALPAGGYKVYAEQAGRIRSFPLAVTVQ